MVVMLDEAVISVVPTVVARDVIPFLGSSVISKLGSDVVVSLDDTAISTTVNLLSSDTVTSPDDTVRYKLGSDMVVSLGDAGQEQSGQ